MDKLNEKDAEHYLQLWEDLIAFVGDKIVYVVKDEEQLKKHMIRDNEYYDRIGNLIWTTNGIDRYIEENEDQLDENDKKILRKMKTKHLTSEFVIIRHMENGSLFLDVRTNKAYLVKGIKSSIEEMTYHLPTPLYMKTTLVPYGECIITNGTGALAELNASKELLDMLESVLQQQTVRKKL